MVVKDTASWVANEKELEQLIQTNEVDSATLIAVTTESHVFEFDYNYGESELKFKHCQQVFHQNFLSKKAQK